MTGPSFLGIWGKQEQMADGTTITVDENYIRESILEPNAKTVAGFQPAMPTFQGLLDDDQIAAVIELIKSLGN
jgi:cytochrome c oxidase subunit 2